MNRARKISSYLRHAVLLFATCLLAAGAVTQAHAADFQDLAVVKPVMSCDQLAQADFSKVTDAKITIKTATVRETEKGPYCRVTGTVDGRINFSGDLPVEHWTQRFIQGAQGREGIEHAGGCQPALNGEIAVVTQASTWNAGNANAEPDPWGVSPQARIDSAYMGQHLTAVGFKDVIKTFYGQAPKFSYMIGCSGGGGQTLMEAERFPADFNGFSIGAPPMYQTVHDLGFWHGWEYHVNQRPDGSIILTKDKLPILHEAAIAHCAAVSGAIDGDLQQPTACKFDKAWVECPAGATDTSKCLTPEEANVAEQLYLGPNDGKGDFFEISGFPLGSELQWRLSSPGKPADNEGLNPHGIHSFIMPPESGETTKDLMAKFSFSQEWFDKTEQMRPLFNQANTNLRPLQQLGDKIILWNGAEDNVVQPAVTIAYYEGVQKEMGAKLTDTFLRYFLLPGVGHCGSGDGANQVDILTPLMAWVEVHKTPMVLVAGRPVAAAGQRGGGQGGGFGGPQAGPGGGPGAPGGPAGQNAAAGPGPGGPGRPQAAPGAPPAYPPYAQPDRPTLYTRPVYPFPNVAKYTGKGDPNDAANYEEVKGPLKVPQAFPNETAKLLGPNNQKFYKVENGQLVVDNSKN